MRQEVNVNGPKWCDYLNFHKFKCKFFLLRKIRIIAVCSHSKIEYPFCNLRVLA